MGETVDVALRIQNFEEFHKGLPQEEQRCEAKRCMSCGVPFCQSGTMIAGMVSGCPLHNLVPETNDLVSRGNLKQAYYRLSKTHCFPEFTSRVCPALCEAACTQGLYEQPVATKSNERAIIEYAFENGLVEEKEPQVRTGKKIAIVGSGPSGMAAALLLNRRGHSVTVYERKDRAGGLLRYGIPNMKLDKRSIDRRVQLMENAGIEFKYGVNVGKDIKAKDLVKAYDRVILCCGASHPRDINVPGREAKGIYFAVDFLSEVSRKLMDHNYDSEAVMKARDFSFGSLKGKSVVVIGGGDTGNDCVGTSVRLGAKSVIQLEMMPAAPVTRAENNPWPEWPKVLKTDYGQEEAIYKFGKDPRIFKTTATEFVKNAKGELCAVKTVELDHFKPVKGTERELKADIVLIAAGFLGSEEYVTSDFGLELTDRTNVATKAGEYETSRKNIFTAGDMHRGQSLVVWAIAEGRAVAKAVDQSLMGYTNIS